MALCDGGEFELSLCYSFLAFQRHDLAIWAASTAATPAQAEAQWHLQSCVGDFVGSQVAPKIMEAKNWSAEMLKMRSRAAQAWPHHWTCC